MNCEPQKEHQWLQKLVGEWTFENECKMGPDQPPAKFSGSETVRSLGGVWVVCEGRGETPGGGMGLMIMSLGYDPAKKRFVGTFIGSMMTNMWVYDGALEGNVLTLDTEGPSFTGENKVVKYQDIIEIVNDDLRTLSSQTLGPDGQWHRFMTANYRRKR
jgi:Protein of unknown function (DUF1579)